MNFMFKKSLIRWKVCLRRFKLALLFHSRVWCRGVVLWKSTLILFRGVIQILAPKELNRQKYWCTLYACNLPIFGKAHESDQASIQSFSVLEIILYCASSWHRNLMKNEELIDTGYDWLSDYTWLIFTMLRNYKNLDAFGAGPYLFEDTTGTG